MARVVGSDGEPDIRALLSRRFKTLSGGGSTPVAIEPAHTGLVQFDDASLGVVHV